MIGQDRIRIGNQTAWSAGSLMAPFEYAVYMGFDAFEWFPDINEFGVGWRESDVSSNMRDMIRDTALRHDMRLSVHATWDANPIFNQGAERLFVSLEFAKDIGASILVTHLFCEQGLSTYVHHILPIIRELSQANIMLAIENTPFNPPDDFNIRFGYLKTFSPLLSKHVGMCFDLGHANLTSMTQNNYIKFISQDACYISRRKI